MMVTAEMMEALGAKKGKARGPDMTHASVAEDSADVFGGAASLEEAVGEWEDGRKGRKKKKAYEKASYDAAYVKFKVANDRLGDVVAAMQGYIAGLQGTCNGQVSLATGLLQAFANVESMYDTVRDYHDIAMDWASVDVPTSLCARMTESLETMVLQPIASHVELRRELEARMAKKKKPEERDAMVAEAKVLEEALSHIMTGPFETMRRCQIDWHTSVAVQMGGGDDLLNGSITAAMSDRGRALTGKTGLTPLPRGGGSDDGSLASAEEGVPPDGLSSDRSLREHRSLSGIGMVGHLSPRQVNVVADVWRDVSGQEPWQGCRLDTGASPGLTLLAAFGWHTEESGRVEPCLFVALQNQSALEVSDIKLELLRCGIGVSCQTPIEFERLGAGKEARGRSLLTLSETGTEETVDVGPEDDFDSFFGDRDATTSSTQSLASWAVDPKCRDLSATFRVTSSIEASTVEASLPYLLLLQDVGVSQLGFEELQRLWHGAHGGGGGTMASAGAVGVVGSGGEEPDDNTTKLCIRMEDPPTILGYTRYDPDTLLSTVRETLLGQVAFGSRLPTNFVFVKKGAPVGKKAESKWRVLDIVPNAVIRNKDPGFAPQPPAHRRDKSQESGLTAVAETQAGGAAGVPTLPLLGGGEREGTGDGGGGGLAERCFSVSTAMDDEVVSRNLQLGGLTLAGRIETSKTRTILLFYAQAGSGVYFLLQVALAHDDGAGGTRTPRALERARMEVAKKDIACTLRGSKGEMLPAFEEGVQCVLSGRGNWKCTHRLLGSGEPFYGDFGGVGLVEAQESAESEQGFVYSEYDRASRISADHTVDDWLANCGYGGQADSIRAALRRRCPSAGNWIQELVQMKASGDLGNFVESAVPAYPLRESISQEFEPELQKLGERASSRSSVGFESSRPPSASSSHVRNSSVGSSSSQAADFDYGEYGGLSLEDAVEGGGGGGEPSFFGFDDFPGGLDSPIRSCSAQEPSTMGSDVSSNLDSFFDAGGGVSVAPPPPPGSPPGLAAYDALGATRVVGKSSPRAEALLALQRPSAGDTTVTPKGYDPDSDPSAMEFELFADSSLRDDPSLSANSPQVSDYD